MHNRFLVARHVATSYNVKPKRFMGHRNVLPSLDGILCAEKFREVLQQEEFDLVYSSPLDRAYFHALVSLGFLDVFEYGGSYTLIPNDNGWFKGEVIIDNRLAERHMGVLQDLYRDDLPEDLRRLYEDEKVNKSFTDAPPGGENFCDLQWKVRSFLHEMDRTHRNKRILIFTHHGNIRIFNGEFEGLSHLELLKKDFKHCYLNWFNEDERVWNPHQETAYHL